MKIKYLMIHKSDNVVVAVDKIEMGEMVAAGDNSFPVSEEINAGHKIA